MKKYVHNRMISIFLICSLILPIFDGCGKTVDSLTEPTAIEINSESKEEMNIGSLSEQVVSNTVEEITNMISLDWQDYIGDIETFVYGLIISELKYQYDVFPAYVDLPDGLVISGIAYTDYEECFTNEEETCALFSAGFIPNVGELDISEEDFNEGLMLYNLDYQDETTEFILKYQCEEFIEHCVVYNKYVTYGVNEFGQIFYEYEDYQKGSCNTELGSLFSYDESQYVFDTEVGEYEYIAGETLSQLFDYESLEAAINEYLKTQDANFAIIDEESCIYFAQEAITIYLLSLQDEVFLGFDVKSLVSYTSGLDPLECYRITSAGLMTINLEYATEEQVAKWLVGSACVITLAAGLVGSMVFMECPALTALSGSIAGTAIEIFTQVVISNGKMSDINWTKVAVAATSGAVSGLLGPYIGATFKDFKYVSGFLDSALDGIIGGTEQVIYAWLDGKEGTQFIKSFGTGFAMGFAISASFKGIGSVVGKVIKKAQPTISRLSAKVFPKLSGKVSSFTTTIGTTFNNIKRSADNSIFHSKYISKRMGMKVATRFGKEGNNKLKAKSFKHLQSKGIKDTNGIPISKETLETIFDEAKDNSIIGYYLIDSDKVFIKKKNGMVGIVFDENKYLTVTLPSGIRFDGGSGKKVKSLFRRNNFLEAATQFKNIWSQSPDLMPEEIATALAVKNIDIKDALPEDLLAIIRKRENGWVMHENIDMQTITLAPRRLHDIGNGGIAHMGGFSLAGFVKTHMGWECFEQLLSTAATETIIAIN